MPEHELLSWNHIPKASLGVSELVVLLLVDWLELSIVILLQVGLSLVDVLVDRHVLSDVILKDLDLVASFFR